MYTVQCRYPKHCCVCITVIWQGIYTWQDQRVRCGFKSVLKMQIGQINHFLIYIGSKSFYLPPLVFKGEAPEWLCLLHYIGVPEQALGWLLKIDLLYVGAIKLHRSFNTYKFLSLSPSLSLSLCSSLSHTLILSPSLCLLKEHLQPCKNTPP